jgi:transglutaminase superfamily protein
MARNAAQRRRADRASHPIKYLRLMLALRTWALWVPLLAQGKDLQPLLARAAPGRGTPYAGLSADTIARCCRRAVRHPILMADRPCLREGLLLNRFLVMAGFAPTLHFGVDPTSLNSPRVKAHCWIKLEERIFNPPDSNMVEIYAHRGEWAQSNASTEHETISNEALVRCEWAPPGSQNRNA